MEWIELSAVVLVPDCIHALYDCLSDYHTYRFHFSSCVRQLVLWSRALDLTGQTPPTGDYTEEKDFAQTEEVDPKPIFF